MNYIFLSILMISVASHSSDKSQEKIEPSKSAKTGTRSSKEALNFYKNIGIDIKKIVNDFKIFHKKNPTSTHYFFSKLNKDNKKITIKKNGLDIKSHLDCLSNDHPNKTIQTNNEYFLINAILPLLQKNKDYFLNLSYRKRVNHMAILVFAMFDELLEDQKYRWGGDGKKKDPAPGRHHDDKRANCHYGLDCSGFIQTVYELAALESYDRLTFDRYFYREPQKNDIKPKPLTVGDVALREQGKYAGRLDTSDIAKLPKKYKVNSSNNLPVGSLILFRRNLHGKDKGRPFHVGIVVELKSGEEKFVLNFTGYSLLNERDTEPKKDKNESMQNSYRQGPSADDFRTIHDFINHFTKDPTAIVEFYDPLKSS